MTTASLRETPLVSVHKELGGRMVDFAGWNMPVQYKSIVAEHMATRQAVGLFDVSHMGEFVVSGAAAHEFVQHMIPNDLDRLDQPGKALYTQMVREDGGTVDDLIVYRRESDYLLIVNASNIAKDWAWLKEHSSRFAVEMTDISDATGLLALQGPKAEALAVDIFGEFVRAMKSFTIARGTVDGIDVTIARTGYTGEDGFEIMVPAESCEKLWKILMERGAGHGIAPCGLGARDTLRLEAGLPLYGHELTDEISPVEAGLGWSVKTEGADFIGKGVLKAQKDGDLRRKVVCLKAEGRALPRQGYAVFAGDKRVGEVTSGSQGIFVGYPIAFALVDASAAALGTELAIEIRDSRVPAAVVKRPFYKRA